MSINNDDANIIQVPEYFYEVDIIYLSHMIADMLGRLTSHNDMIPLTPSTLTRFHSRIPPNITLTDYLRRIIKFTSLEKSCLLIILIYIDRVCERHPHFTISSLTVHRFLITAVTLSSKALSDSYCTNTFYAKIGGITTQELNALELEFLWLIDWHLVSTGVMLQQYYANLVEQHPRYERLVTPHPLHPSLSTDTTSSSRKRRRRSTLTAIPDLDPVQNPSAPSSSLNSTSTPPPPPIDNDGTHTSDSGRSSSTEDEEEAQRIWAHFDQLAAQDHIPYVA
ncbi:cyclin-domain-containing protein [Hesseltinella vesiculosa]|uniref:Cyclin-domain-containing protein n=1 Tax=Hesseltinella vesiculosa TaxID=101127 RepID=A0A1X2GGH6_9FUNG|nr:cyclin-domain-containing protein [Hesseltinella vesiculosa]